MAVIQDPAASDALRRAREAAQDAARTRARIDALKARKQQPARS
ncbi:hypothetical protein [Streptomyces sp. NBRC 110465]|nr:hypothetical protein [Streptomyces sp. NBRC 110465]